MAKHSQLPFGLQILIRYIRFINKYLMIRKRYTVGLENLPSEDERYLIISNHQNTANDPINIIFALPFHYSIAVMARANVFSLHPLFTKLITNLGLVPAFRSDFDGGDTVEKNNESFDIIAERVNNKHPFLVFPEGGHTQGHYLDPFTTGFVRIAFHCAAKTNWEEDIKIVPTAHHYEDFFIIQSDFLWTIGEPLSLKPYYEEYQAHPYKVLRKIKNAMHEKVRSQMLDMGSDDYEIKDFIRCSYLHAGDRNALTLPERLKFDQEFAEKLRNNTNYAEIISDATELKKAEEALGLKDETIAKAPSLISSLPTVLMLLVLLPLFIVSLWPNGICYRLPLILLKTDKMFTNTYRYLIPALVLYPLAAIITLAVLWGGFGLPWLAIIWILLWIPLAHFAWFYYRKLKSVVQTWRYAMNKGQLGTINTLREKIKSLL